MGWWSIDVGGRVLRYTQSVDDEPKEMRRKAWNAAHSWAYLHYSLIERDEELDCVGEVDGTYGWWEVKTCHMDTGNFLLKSEQHGDAMYYGEGYIFVVLERLDDTHWSVVDHTVVEVERVDDLVGDRNWVGCERDYEQLQLPYTVVPGLDPVSRCGVLPVGRTV